MLKNTTERYGIVAIIFHWLMAILIIGLLSLGLYMEDLPVSLQKLKLYGWHKELGMLVLSLVIIRLTWRQININPQLVLPWWEKVTARTVHYGLYGFMFAMPFTGWLLTSAAGLPVSFFGLFVIPNLTQPHKDMISLFADIHTWLAYGLIAAIVLHTCAALKHHFINKDDILWRMLK